MNKEKTKIDKEFFKSLKEFTMYEVEVSYNTGNPVHKAFLFTGFSNGNGWEVYINNYENAEPVTSVYYIKIIKEICNLK